MMKLYTIETESRIFIEAANTPEEARRQGVQNIGRFNFTRMEVREATKDDIEWVKVMGGYVPETTDDEKEEAARDDQNELYPRIP